MKLHAAATALLAGLGLIAIEAATAQERGSSPFVELPQSYNTLDGISRASDGTFVVSVPNFNNTHLSQYPVKHGASPALMLGVREDGSYAPWYEFTAEELHPDTLTVGPMASAFGPDGHLYVNDMQVFYDRARKSRILRIVVEDGRPQRAEVVATGFIAANGMDWEGDTLFISESILKDPTVEGNRSDRLLSGAYAFSLDELSAKKPVQVQPYEGNGDLDGGDPHLVQVFQSSNRAGFGADGIAVGGDGALYIGVIEDAVIYRVELDGTKALGRKRFVEGDPILSTDGLIWSDERQAFFLADFFGNKVHQIDPNGDVTVLAENGDTTGADGGLDMPAVVFEDTEANRLIVANFDAAWAAPEGLRVNTSVDGHYQLVQIPLPAAD